MPEIKKGTLSQFTQAETLAAVNEADNFDFQAAYDDWNTWEGSQNIERFTVAHVFFCAGIALGKKIMLGHLEETVGEVEKLVTAINEYQPKTFCSCIEPEESIEHTNSMSCRKFCGRCDKTIK